MKTQVMPCSYSPVKLHKHISFLHSKAELQLSALPDKRLNHTFQIKIHPHETLRFRMSDNRSSQSMVSQHKTFTKLKKQIYWPEKYLDLSIATSNNFKCVFLPICIEISPMAQVALLHTEINSGFRLSPKMGINSARGRQ